MYSGGFMMNRTILLVGLSTLLLFFSTHGIPLVNAQTSSPTDNTSNDNSASQTQNSDPFTQKDLITTSILAVIIVRLKPVTDLAIITTVLKPVTDLAIITT